MYSGRLGNQQRNNVASTNISIECPTGVAVHPLGELLISPALMVRKQRWSIAEFLREFLYDDRKGARRILSDERRHFQSA